MPEISLLAGRGRGLRSSWSADDRKIVSLLRTTWSARVSRWLRAGDGRAALAAVAQMQPRLIVLDMMLPELDGLALMRLVRERSELPILIIWARGSTADRVHGIHEGADDYLAKPFSPAELVERVKAILSFDGSGAGSTNAGGMRVR